MIILDPKKCRRCQHCPAARACAMGALIQVDPEDVPSLRLASCHGCGDCVRLCPSGALRLPTKKVTH